MPHDHPGKPPVHDLNRLTFSSCRIARSPQALLQLHKESLPGRRDYFSNDGAPCTNVFGVSFAEN